MSLANEQSLTPLKLGILGGTFDPIHYGHLTPAIDVANWLGLTNISLMPAHIPPHKQSTSVNAKHRVAMVQAVCQQYPLFQLDDRELRRDGPSYTVETLRQLKQQLPNSQLYFLLGMDSLLNFNHWHQWQQILSLCHLVVSARPHYVLEHANPTIIELINQRQVTDLTKLTSTSCGAILFAPTTCVDISSTELRQQLANHQTNLTLLPTSVADYIHNAGLYSSSLKQRPVNQTR